MRIKIIRAPKKRREFSKKFIAVVCLLWIAGALFGGLIVWREPGNLSYLLDYIGAPMVSGIIGYMAKAALENREKIKRDTPEEPTPQEEP